MRDLDERDLLRGGMRLPRGPNGQRDRALRCPLQEVVAASDINVFQHSPGEYYPAIQEVPLVRLDVRPRARGACVKFAPEQGGCKIISSHKWALADSIIFVVWRHGEC